MIEPNNISFRDTAARVVKKENGYYRYIFNEYKAEYKHLMQSGLYKELTHKRLLIEHKEIPIDTDDPKVYKLLYPNQIPFQSYPFEWSFLQWRNAILAYLRINYIALNYGMILKDATPYNFYITGGKAVMFDTSSFMFFKENDKWIAYRQFCEEFLSPIVLMHYNGAEWSKLTMANLRGMPLSFVSKQLPIKSCFNLTTLINIHIHSRFSVNNQSKELENKSKKGFTIVTIKSLLKIIINTITTWRKSHEFSNHWSSYYENDIESTEYLKDKESIIREWIEMFKPESVLDLGANTGKFSFIAADYAKRVISLEEDEKCVFEIEKKISEKNIDNVFAFIGNIAEPSPCIGLLNSETNLIYERAKSDLVLALGLIHHLYIINKFNFEQITKILSDYCQSYLIIEFIPISDNKIQLLALNNQKILEKYSFENFIYFLSTKFKLKKKISIKDSKRILLLLEKTNNLTDGIIT